MVADPRRHWAAFLSAAWLRSGLAIALLTAGTVYGAWMTLARYQAARLRIEGAVGWPEYFAGYPFLEPAARLLRLNPMYDPSWERTLELHAGFAGFVSIMGFLLWVRSKP